MMRPIFVLDALCIVLCAVVYGVFSYRDGARENSCYDHSIEHGLGTSSFPCDPLSCSFFLRIREVVDENTLELGNEVNAYQCGRIYGIELANTLSDPEGYLIQARNGTDVSSEIIGTFLDPDVVRIRDPFIDINYKILNCNRSILNIESGDPLPNSATQFTSVDSAGVLQLYWQAPSCSACGLGDVTIWFTVVQQLQIVFATSKTTVLSLQNYTEPLECSTSTPVSPIPTSSSTVPTSSSIDPTTVPPATPPATTVSPMTIPPPPPPPLGVQGLCSVVVWYSPMVSCEDIHGYEVRLYNPQSPSHRNMTSHIGANRTFYIVDQEKLVSSKEIYVQVRVIHITGVGEWSEGISLGCEKPTVPEKPPRVHFELNGKIYLNNSAIAISEIGEGDEALYCRTDKEKCCGMVPNRFGQFFYPNGLQVPIHARQQGFYRNRGDQIIRLNRREGVTSPSGTYRCEIPNADDQMINIYITLTRN